MGTIKRLPESVRNTMRSGIVVYDLTRVVEELVFNSLDAGAKKVSVYVAIGTCFVKVVDDGCGISRDGLVLLGERYVTSKVEHLADVDVASGGFGFRGETLSSIADVSVLGISTKARGRPNGYCRVMKGSKCLHMGISDAMKETGTTVTVRDLFYNQPVRRRYMQSSPKKILHSVKKSILRIALMHSKVSFKIVDAESDEELLCTRPSSAFSLLMNVFGIEDSSLLHELNVSDGLLKLSGHISGPRSNFSIKVFQYVYINSRFVGKGPIHKLLSQLASRFENPDMLKGHTASQKGKRSAPPPVPAYILNLSCPSSLYDLTFEPSKTHAEFKDWNPILAFIEKVIQQLWRESAVAGESSSPGADKVQKSEIWQEDFLGADLAGFAMKNHEIKNDQSPHHFVSSSSKMLTDEVVHPFYGDRVPSQEFYLDVSEFKEEQAALESVCQIDKPLQLWDGSIAKYMHTATKKSESRLLSHDDNFLFPDDCFLEDSFATKERSSDYMENHFLCSEWKNKSPKIDCQARNESLGSVLAYDHYEFGGELLFSKSNKKPILQSCTAQRSLSLDGDLFVSKEGFEFPDDGFKKKRRRICMNENTGFWKDDERFDTFPCALRQDKASWAPRFPAHIVGDEMSAEFALPSGASANSFASNRKLFAEEKDLASDSILQMDIYDSGGWSSKSDWFSVTSDALFQAKNDTEHFPDDNTSRRYKRWSQKANHWDFANGSEIMSKPSGKDNFLSGCSSSELDVRGSADYCKNTCKFLEAHNQHNKFALQDLDISTGQTDWLLLDPGSNAQQRNDKYEMCGNQLRYRDCEQDQLPKERSRRSNSAPPFFRPKRRFVSLNNHSMRKVEKSHTELFRDKLTSPEANDSDHLPSQPNPEEVDLSFSTKFKTKDMPDFIPNMKESAERNLELSQCPGAYNSSVEGFREKDAQASIDYGTKWRNGCQQIADHNMSVNSNIQHDILNISSGFLHLSGNSLVPESLHKNCLEEARVLLQVDKKFIPIVAGGTLAVIDQHAADERIRLEELRQKVLSGEAKTVTYLAAEQELVLPEMGYQLLHSYAERVREWGWICNIQGSGTFKRNLNILHQQPAVITLLAVPCILGVNLSDGDLLEFLQQLADTDGSSTLPPSVLRVLNYKACRGAIMFGDSLLPSKCSLLVEELKQTSLCFQCAHGRPTTAPVVHLEALHKQIAKLRLLNGGSNDLWRGLRRQEISLERAAERLNAARG